MVMEGTSDTPVVGVIGGAMQQGELERLEARVAALEEENDLLAVAATNEPQLIADVQRLTDRVAELESENRALTEANERLSLSLETPGGSSSNDGIRSDPLAPRTADNAEDQAAPFVVPGDKQASVRRVRNTLRGCHGGTNVLCARVCPGVPDIVASGGADKSLLISRLAVEATDRDGGNDGATAAAAAAGLAGGDGLSASEVHRVRLAAPLLSLDFCPPSNSASVCGGNGRGLLLAGSMDGGSHLISVGAPSKAEQEEEEEDDTAGCLGSGDGSGVSVLASMKDHTKYVVVCRWAPDGSAFITASHDKVVTLYTLRGSGSVERGQGGAGVGGTGYEQATRLYFPEAVESAEFVRGEGDALELVVSARGQPHLTYVNIETLQQRQVSLNENDWDTHVSFTVMALVASPDGKYILGATDKSRNILWRAGSNTRVRTLMGQSTDDYFQPRVAWEPSGLFSYCNSSGDNDIHVHCLASGRVVEQLKGHSSVVRDIHHDPSVRTLVTASYDKTVKIWG